MSAASVGTIIDQYKYFIAVLIYGRCFELSAGIRTYNNFISHVCVAVVSILMCECMSCVCNNNVSHIRLLVVVGVDVSSLWRRLTDNAGDQLTNSRRKQARLDVHMQIDVGLNDVCVYDCSVVCRRARARTSTMQIDAVCERVSRVRTDINCCAIVFRFFDNILTLNEY